MSTLFSLALALQLTTAAPASAQECPSGQDRAQIEAFRDRIAGAESPAAARELALTQTRMGHEAIRRASRALPGDSAIAEADARLSAFEAGVNAAETQAQVAGQLDTLVQTETSLGSCDYTRTEIVIIIIGFLLGILPGILFLFLFC